MLQNSQNHAKTCRDMPWHVWLGCLWGLESRHRNADMPCPYRLRNLQLCNTYRVQQMLMNALFRSVGEGAEEQLYAAGVDAEADGFLAVLFCGVKLVTLFVESGAEIVGFSVIGV